MMTQSVFRYIESDIFFDIYDESESYEMGQKIPFFSLFDYSF